MSENLQLLLYAVISIVGLIILIGKFKLNPFISLVIAGLAMGLMSGMKLGEIATAYQTGAGNIMATIAIILGLGTMLGKLMAESGGAERIARTMISRFGEKKVHWIMLIVAFICGIPVFLQVGVVLLIPLVYTLARSTGTSLIKIGVAMLAGVAVVHSLVPPHAAAMAVIGILKADVGMTLLYSIIVGFPAAIIAGPLYGSWIAKRVNPEVSKELMGQFGGSENDEKNLPGFGITMFTILLPIILMLIKTAVDLSLPDGHGARTLMSFIGHPITSLLISLVVAMFTFGFARGMKAKQMSDMLNDCLSPTASILLIIAAGGGFNAVLVTSGVGEAIASYASALNLSVLLLGFAIAGLIRASIGSATVSMTTAAGIVLPIAEMSPGTNMELLVLAIGAGSIMLSHVNDSGFWLVKQYFNMTVSETLKTWTVMMTIMSFAAFAMVLLMSMIV
ncbi:gluconate:H+ symporter [Paenibacillus sp. LHD-117]|uniref:GntT/GntP/DsdX family permease n=1 Tax=Paenibacillus sp. LHD-117 TaxID=3071412 RepID=UPI0027E0571F|nr:gluconate:H+ symporter [Paenibacillus sp. LHD-117]MDQ6419828.1 gluconate:H+ symporter [Paenibacillus sp. LHD-117]